jgi:hypothetical protein
MYGHQINRCSNNNQSCCSSRVNSSNTRHQVLLPHHPTTDVLLVYSQLLCYSHLHAPPAGQQVHSPRGHLHGAAAAAAAASRGGKNFRAALIYKTHVSEAK